MEAKEKAKELVRRFTFTVMGNLSEYLKKYATTLDISDFAKMVFDETERTHLIGKKLAILHIDELMKDHEECFNQDDRNYEHTGHYKFYTEVKSEIEKI